jgi:hypothetical protein
VAAAALWCSKHFGVGNDVAQDFIAGFAGFAAHLIEQLASRPKTK